MYKSILVTHNPHHYLYVVTFHLLLIRPIIQKLLTVTKDFKLKDAEEYSYSSSQSLLQEPCD